MADSFFFGFGIISFRFVSKLLCVGVRRGYSSDLRLNVVRLTATEAFLDDGSVPEDIDGATFLHVQL